MEGWGEGTDGKVCPSQIRGPEYDLQNLHKSWIF